MVFLLFLKDRTESPSRQAQLPCLPFLILLKYQNVYFASSLHIVSQAQESASTSAALSFLPLPLAFTVVANLWVLTSCTGHFAAATGAGVDGSATGAGVATGQLWRLHGCISSRGGQAVPPFAAAVVMLRARFFIPPPHDAEHSPNSPKAPTTQSTVDGPATGAGVDGSTTGAGVATGQLWRLHGCISS